MDFYTALALLGISRQEKANAGIVRKAWKIKIAKAHPDKNHCPNALILSQRLNEAKDVLLDALKGENDNAQKKEQEKRDEEMARQKELFQKLVRERQRQTEEREKLVREREQMQMEAEAEEKKKLACKIAEENAKKEKEEEEEKAKKQKEEEEEKAKKQKEEEEEEAMERERKRLNFIKNRRPRAPGSRIHKKIEDYPEGRELVKEFKNFFTFNVTEKAGDRVFCRDLFNAFIQYRLNRGLSTSKLEMEMFWRHGKRMLMQMFPNCKHTAYKHQRCYLHISFLAS